MCVEEVSGVCLKYQNAAPAAPAPAAPKPQLSPQAAEEARLGLNRQQRRRIQAALAELGHYRSSIDGILGRGSRAAIGRWQASLGYSATGYLTAAQAAQLQATPTGRAENAAAPGDGALPKAGVKYQKSFYIPGDLVGGDVYVTVERSSATTAKLTVRLAADNEVAASFTQDCEIPVSGSFSCAIYARRVGATWNAYGELPRVNLLNRTLDLW